MFFLIVHLYQLLLICMPVYTYLIVYTFFYEWSYNHCYKQAPSPYDLEYLKRFSAPTAY